MNLILFGAPGSGKGTQALMFGERLNVRRISLGDILREEVKKDSELGNEVKGYMDKGLLVPDEVVAKVIEANLNTNGFVLDGYPRNINQAKTLDEILDKKGMKLDAVIYLDVDEDTIVSRLSKRLMCKSCDAIYHLDNMPPKKEGICDKCGATLIQRDDDTPEVIRKRWDVFMKANEPILDFYSNKNKLIKVDGRGNRKEEIFEKIKSQLQCQSV